MQAYYVDAQLLQHLSPPPAAFVFAMQRLLEIQKRFGQERFREHFENQSTKDTRRQLEALRGDLGGLKPRAWSSLRHALGAVFLEDPVGRDLADGKYLGMMLYNVMTKAVDRAIADLQKRRRGNPGKTSNSSRQAARELIDLFCECRGAKRPSYDFFAEEVRNPEALEFAIACLKSWKAPAADGLSPNDLIRSL